MIHRRQLLKKSAAFSGLAVLGASTSHARTGTKSGIVDTNVSLFRWPFRRLPLDETNALVDKLRSLGIIEAWAGSFEALLHRDISAVNQRLVDECRRQTLLIPIGAVNLSLHDWRADLRFCMDQEDMPGVRLHPNYHQYSLDDDRFLQLLQSLTEAGRFVQIVVAMEDVRTQHRGMMTPNVDLRPLPDVIRKVEGARVQILNERPRQQIIDWFTDLPGVYFDTARVDSTDGVPQLIQSLPEGRVMCGTHSPFLIPEAALIRTHESSRLDDASLHALYFSNAHAFRGSPERVTQADSLRGHPGLPSSDRLARYRIWDSYFTPSHSHPGRSGQDRLLADIERALPAIRRARFEKLCYFAHVGVGTTSDHELEESLRTHPGLVLKPLEKFPDLLIGMIQLNAHDVDASLDAINRWLMDGPMQGVYFPGSGAGALTCTNRNLDALVDRVAQLKGVIMQHTWFNSLGKQHPGASTPADLAELARRFPEQHFLCAHAGGEWQQGIRAVRDCSNISVETSGFDATAGFIEMAVRELGAERVVFGSHLPSRSLGTELGKVVGARITESEKRLILGDNFRRLLRRT